MERLRKRRKGAIDDTEHDSEQDAVFDARHVSEDGVGTNPEELIGAAHAGCYAMALAFALQGAGFTPDSLEVTATINFEIATPPPTITQSALVVKAKIPGITDEKFQELAKGAKEGCPVSRVLKAEVTLDAKLV